MQPRFSTEQSEQKTTHQFFQPQPEEARLMQLVIEANYVEAKSMVKANPSLMFKEVNFRHPAGTVELISPLKCIFKLYDAYMRKIFLDEIHDNAEYMQMYLQQYHEQKEHINLDALFQAYEDYIEQYKKFDAERAKARDETKDPSILADLNKKWLEIGVKQKELLPWYILKEFCRFGNDDSIISCRDSWSPESLFDTNVLPEPLECTALEYDFSAGRLIPINLSPSMCPAKLGVGFTLTRESVGQQGWLWDRGTAAMGSDGAVNDLKTLRHLLEVRAKDQENHIVSLTAQVQNSNLSL